MIDLELLRTPPWNQYPFVLVVAEKLLAVPAWSGLVCQVKVSNIVDTTTQYLHTRKRWAQEHILMEQVEAEDQRSKIPHPGRKTEDQMHCLGGWQQERKENRRLRGMYIGSNNSAVAECFATDNMRDSDPVHILLAAEQKGSDRHRNVQPRYELEL
jgi:hypothetical protein